MEPEKKRHHFVPKAYLKAFCNAEGKLLVYRKDDPENVLKMAPDAIGFEKYYYAQPLPGGGRDTNMLENMFSELEGQWPALAARLTNGEDVNDQLSVLLEFIALQRVRVPASRDVTEGALANLVKQTLNRMHLAGELPPMPAGLGLSDVTVAIDPHQSIHGMVTHLQLEVAGIIDRAGFWAVRNETGRPFLTSDNPVIWFDETQPEDARRPYAIKSQGPFILVFPVSPTLVILGAPNHKEVFSRYGLRYSAAPTEDWVAWINEEVSRFAYEAVFAQREGEEEVVKRHQELPPWRHEELTPGLLINLS
ncbi:DUF4238 domain-containing protein [Variovorax sp. Root411]|uniref:DUF4238 domain-containing protein n=1 Tax=Variovorax sp. Root411 TaxID=1736530 RepID=UPI0006FB9AB0|nr:DUF4238 domain-containing protein [Variovorax sp. Root411]KQW60469.1 hypothetical protein ASC92_27675 [Variovorax sp. Root411]